MCSDHLGNFAYTWTGMEGNGEPMWAEAESALLAVLSAHNMGLFQFLNSITRVFTYFFTYIYFLKIQTTYQTAPSFLKVMLLM